MTLPYDPDEDLSADASALLEQHAEEWVLTLHIYM